jgi:large subunit ribosomal protein L22e/Meckel syndrome type 1 protein
MNRLILAAALAAGCALASSSPAFAAPKNYDCTKPGNANKTACKTAAKSPATAAAKATPAAAKAAPAKAAKPAETKVSSTTTTKTVTEKNYDCSKAGNKNKAVCKSAAATPAKPIAKQTTVATTTRHYDCTKPGNANKQECKVSTASTQTAAKPVAETKPTMLQRMKNALNGTSAPAPKPAAAPATARKASAPSAASVEDKNPAGAIAQCKDGTYSHAKQRTGACSRHGGVAKWS